MQRRHTEDNNLLKLLNSFSGQELAIKLKIVLPDERFTAIYLGKCRGIDSGQMPGGI